MDIYFEFVFSKLTQIRVHKIIRIRLAFHRQKQTLYLCTKINSI